MKKNLMAFSIEIQSELDAHLLPWQDVSTRKMFGAMVYLVGGKMFAFIYDARLVVKLPEEDKAEARERDGARPFILGNGSQFGDWMEFPISTPDRVEEALTWVGKSYQYVQATPRAGKARPRRRR